MKINRFINGVPADESALDGLTLLLPTLTAAIDSVRRAEEGGRKAPARSNAEDRERSADVHKDGAVS